MLCERSSMKPLSMPARPLLRISILLPPAAVASVKAFGATIFLPGFFSSGTDKNRPFFFLRCASSFTSPAFPASEPTTIEGADLLLPVVVVVVVVVVAVVVVAVAVAVVLLLLLL